MLKTINAILKSGVRPSLSPSMIVRVRILNALCLIIIPISVIYGAVNYEKYFLAFVLNAATVGMAIIAFVFNRWQRHYTAFYLFAFLELSLGLIFSIGYGRFISADLLFCVGIAYSCVMFDSWQRITLFVLLNILAYIGANFAFEQYYPLYLMDAHDISIFFYPNMFVFLGLLSLLIILMKTENNRLRTQTEAQTDAIEQARDKSEELLLNILPREIAAELQEKGFVEPRQYEHVTVMFTDFYGFTISSEKMTAMELVSELDVYFSAFDVIIEKHGLEKLKTIGDAYMCACGIPAPDPDHAYNAVMAAIEIRGFVAEMKQRKILENKPCWDVRIGINTGPVVSGVIGERKFAFDIWGDTVNTASRMESSSEPGKINISESTYGLVHERIPCTPRGKVIAKSKGEMHMYFVE